MARAMQRLLCALAALTATGAIAACPALAQPTDLNARPSTAKRVVHVFDFEEGDFNPEPVPRYWYRAQNDPEVSLRPGFPLFNRAVMDGTHSFSGKTSVLLPTAGGSTSLRLQPGIIPVLPGADYVISSRVRAVGLIHSRAFLRARFLDERRRVIPGSERHSAPIGASVEWTEAVVQLQGLPNASFLEIDLELLQPEQFLPAPPLPERDVVWPQDYRARAWFDDVSVFQAPRVTVRTDEATGVVVGPTPPELLVTVRDMVGERLTARLRVEDVAGRVIFEQVFPADPSGREMARPIPLTKHGWYRAMLQVDGPGGPVGWSEMHMLWLPEPDPTSPPFRDPPSPDRRRFGLLIENAPTDRLDTLPALYDRSGVGALTLDAYGPEVGPATIDADFAQRRPVIDALLARNAELTLALTGVPDALAARHHLDPDDPLQLAELDPALWTPHLLPTLDLFGQRITHWQLGPSGSDAAFWSDDLTGAIDALADPIRRLVPGPTINVPWRAEFPPPEHPARTSDGSTARTSVLAATPVGFGPDAMATIVSGWESEAPDLAIGIELPDGAEVGHVTRIIHLAQNAISAWAAGSEDEGTPPSMAIATPWAWPKRPGQSAAPAPELGVWRTLVERLGGRRAVATVPASPGVRAYVLAEPSSDGTYFPRGALVAWNESALEDDATLTIHPSRDAPLELVDLFGNRTLLAPAGQTEPVTITTGPEPVFVEGVDPYLAAFIAAFRIEPEFVPSLIIEHRRSLVIANPWPVRITGKLQIVEPGPEADWPGWTFSPKAVQPFSLGPGQSATLPLSFAFGPGEEAGPREIVSVVRLTADRPYPPIRIATRIEIGLRDLEVATDVRLAPTPSGPDVVVAVRVTNVGNTPRTIVLRAAAPGQPSQQIPISNLAPHVPTTRQFVFPGAAATLSGRRVRIGLDDVDSPGRLNTSVIVP